MHCNKRFIQTMYNKVGTFVLFFTTLALATIFLQSYFHCYFFIKWQTSYIVMSNHYIFHQYSLEFKGDKTIRVIKALTGWRLINSTAPW